MNYKNVGAQYHVHGIIIFNDTGRGEVTSPSSVVVTPYSKKKPVK